MKFTVPYMLIKKKTITLLSIDIFKAIHGHEATKFFTKPFCTRPK